MQLEAVGVALFAIAFGVYTVLNPHGRHVESLPSAREWQENPEEAERTQKAWAKGFGGLLILLGIGVLVSALVVP